MKGIEVDKLRGMLVGLAVGDALGATAEGITEFLTAKQIEERGYDFSKMTKSHIRNIPKGAWTDDTSMALCLADSLLGCGGYNSFDVMEKYLRWRDEGYRSSIGCCFDIGMQTDSAIVRFDKENPIIDKDEPRVWAAGNGSIMRLAPVVIATAKYSTIEEVMKLARISARETHYSEEAEAGTEIFAAMLYQALSLTDKKKIVDVVKFSTGKVYEDIINQANKKYTKEGLQNLGGYVVDALKIAVWGFLNFDNFRDGMIEVIKLGGDTDTNGAIYGQLAGAYYGYSAIPTEWKRDLIMETEIKELADKLAKMKSCPILETRFEEDNS